ncbi:MAG: hypothetical protein V2B14_05035 [bacterium]
MFVFQHKLDYDRSKNFKFQSSLLEEKNFNNLLLYLKFKKIKKLISNIYIYKFPPILNWPEGANIDIPVNFAIAIKKMFEHSSKHILDNIKELCFSMNTDDSSYGDKILIIPIEYITKDYNKIIFLDTFAHELGHALLFRLSKIKKYKNKIIKNHKIIRFYSIKFDNNFFFNPQITEKNLSKYQLEDYREFFSELFSHVLNHFDKLINYIYQIKSQKVKFAYISTVDLLLNYVMPFSKDEIRTLVKNLE